MAPAFSKPKLTSLSATIGLTAAGLLCLGYFVYRILRGNGKSEENGELQESDDGENRFQSLMDSLDSGNDDRVLNGLCTLGNLTAFREFQILVREHSGLQKIIVLLKSRLLDIKIQALYVINNLAMDMQNQEIFRDLIPELAGMLHDPDSSVKLYLAVTRVLTNLTTLDENHDLLLPHCVYLFDLLKSSEQLLKLQVLKILVNLSTNERNVENLLEVDLQIISAIAEFVDPSMNEDILLRAVTCLANILSALHRKWNSGEKRLVSTAEFVPVDMKGKLEELLQHSNEEVQMKSQRALSALTESLSSKTGHIVKDVDLVEVLRL